MRDYVRLSGVLLLICLIAAALLGYVNSVTADKILEQTELANAEARKVVLPTATDFTPVDQATLDAIKAKYDTITEVYAGNANGSVVGYAIKTTPKGYGGAVEVMVGIGADGVIQGIKVGNNSETPGLGKKSQTPDFQSQYNGKSWDADINVIKSGTPKENEISAISGATITSKAVTLGVNQAMAAAKELSNK